MEHLLFKTMEYVENKHPGLLDHIEGSLDHLGDASHDETKNDEAVRMIAQRMITKHDPLRDAVVLAQMLIDDPRLGNTREL